MVKLFQILFWCSYLVWLLALTLVSPLSLLIPDSDVPLDRDLVFGTDTICRLLHEHEVLSEEDYMFEHTLVVDSHNLDIFKGYRVLVEPVVFTLKRTRVVDNHVMYFVRSWMRVQRERLLSHGEAPGFHKLFTKYAIFMARGTGKFVRFFGA